MKKLLILMLSIVFYLPSNGQRLFQAMKHMPEGGYSLNGSEIKNEKGEVLTTVTLDNGKLDFTCASGQTRYELLVFLYDAGLREIMVSMQETWPISPKGRIGPKLNEYGIIQALEETKYGYDLTNFNNSAILDYDGKELAKVVILNDKAKLHPIINGINQEELVKKLHELSIWKYYTKQGQTEKIE